MTNPNTCAQPTLLLQYGQSTKEEGESGTHLSDVCMITQTSPLPSGYQSRRLILEIFPESEPRSASARDAARVAPRASAAPPAAGPSSRRSAPPAPSAGRPSRSRRARPHGRVPPSHAAAPPRLCCAAAAAPSRPLAPPAAGEEEDGGDGRGGAPPPPFNAARRGGERRPQSPAAAEKMRIAGLRAQARRRISRASITVRQTSVNYPGRLVRRLDVIPDVFTDVWATSRTS